MNYTFRHPKIAEFTEQLSGQRISWNEFHDGLRQLISEVVLQGLSEQEKQKHPFLQALKHAKPNGTSPFRALFRQNQPATVLTRDGQVTLTAFGYGPDPIKSAQPALQPA
ncbi:MAG TPA: hypothetical protein V6C99_07160 [Oculatellaceae cyanobacterium]